MAFTPLSEVALPEGSRCAVHAESAATNACRRCGTFCCAACSAPVDGYVFCATCLESDEVNYLEATRRRFWGKRDGWVWLYGLWFVSGIASIPRNAQEGAWFGAATSLAGAAIGVGCLALWPPARKLVVWMALPMLVTFIVNDGYLRAAGPADSHRIASARTILALSFVIYLALAFTAYRSPRNRLAFRLPVSDAGLRRVYAHYVANPYAARAAAYGIASLLIPIAAPFTLWLALTARKRARASTFPPSSGSRAALVGLVASVTSLVFWLTLLAFTFAT